MVNSPATYLAAGITASVTTIPVLDSSKLPAAPNLATIGTGETAETILYTGKSGNDLTGVTRGFQGTARAWNQGIQVARYLTAYDISQLQTAVASAITKVSDDASPALAGNLTGGGYKATNIGIENYYETCVVANSGTAYTFNLANGNTFFITMTGNCTFTMPSLPAEGSGKTVSFTVRLVQDATGNRTITFPSANVMWPSGVAPTFSTAAGRIDKVVFVGWPGATKWEGNLAGVNYA